MKIEIKERIEKIKNKEIPEGYKKTKFGPIPKSWKEITIASLVKEKKELCSDEITPLYSLTIEAGIVPKSERYEREHLVKDTESAYKKVNINEFAYNPMNVRFGAIGRLLENKTVKVSKYYNIFEVKKNVDLIFFEAVIKNKRALNYYDSISTGTLEEKKRVHYNDFIKIEIPFPPIEEQEKISTILSKWDEGISNQEKLIEAKKKYKKGMMQKLFSQKLRFKDENGNDYLEWEEKKLGEVLTIGNGKDYKHLNEGDIPVFGTGGYMTSVDKYLHDGETVFIGRKGTINKPFYYNGKFWTVDTLFYTHNFKNSFPKFIYVIFQNIDWLQYNEASGVPSLSKSTINNISINLPSLSEQEKIANFLSTIDREIELLEKELSVLKNEKQSLMSMLLNGVVRTV